MKITLDLPDTIRCAFFNYVHQGSTCMLVGCKLLDSDDLKNGVKIKIVPEEPDQD